MVMFLASFLSSRRLAEPRIEALQDMKRRDRADPARSSPWAGQAPQEVHQGGLDLVPEVVQALEQVEGGDVEGMAGTAQSM